MRWSVTEKNGEPVDPAEVFANKGAMFTTMRERLGLDGEFRCESGAGGGGRYAYAYRVTAHGFDRIEGITPPERRRTGRKRRG